MIPVQKQEKDTEAIMFCRDFISSRLPKFIFGRNEYAESISSNTDVDGFIDDFTDEKYFLGKPIVKIDKVPADALIVNTVPVGRPLTAKKRIDGFNLRNLDYFAFLRYSGLGIQPITNWENFENDFDSNRDKYERVYSLMSDELSRDTFAKLINFRLSFNLRFMNGFDDIQYRQYFEDFLNLDEDNAVFADVGGFDGATSLEFIRRYPRYRHIHYLEPQEGMMEISKSKLKDFRNISFYTKGASDSRGKIRFDVSGSSSRASDKGNAVVEVDRLDNIIEGKVTYIKMDIEGAEGSAINGAKGIIEKYNPSLAISVYHKPFDFREIPFQILDISDKYKIYLRHYTEGFSETVMFFIPK